MKKKKKYYTGADDCVSNQIFLTRCVRNNVSVRESEEDKNLKVNCIELN